MESATVLLTQSKFYSPVFNAAIFDGPIKIYFSQAQEGVALQLYFQLQRKVEEMQLGPLENSDRTIFIMLYPNSESFYNSFDKNLVSDNSDNDLIIEDVLGTDPVIGVRGPVEESTLENVYNKIKNLTSIYVPNFLEEGSEVFA
ncbi:MAG: hypothetical protein KDD58_03180 [Bdellovibrionales bacterium]|nr:hypothetical protein [Bdellovibrionales bacterium]